MKKIATILLILSVALLGGLFFSFSQPIDVDDAMPLIESLQPKEDLAQGTIPEEKQKLEIREEIVNYSIVPQLSSDELTPIQEGINTQLRQLALDYGCEFEDDWFEHDYNNLDYAVTFFDQERLSVKITYALSCMQSAHPINYAALSRVFNLEDGELISLYDLYDLDETGWYELIRTNVQNEDCKENALYANEDLAYAFNEYLFTLEENGIKIYLDYPHALEICSEEVLIPSTELIEKSV